MKFAFIIMGNFDYPKDSAEIHNGDAQIIGVNSIEQACDEAKKLYQKGVNCIELCGAFGKEGAKKIIEVTENKIPVGYITHLPIQNEIYKKTFEKN